MKAVLLDPPVAAATAGTLAAEPRAAFVHGDGFDGIAVLGAAELPRHRQPSHAAPDDHHALSGQ
jgi:hypothetical protein